MTNQIFLVDDDPDNLDMLACCLSEEPYEITTFTDPSLCLKAAENTPPDLIVSDVALRSMNGFELCKSIHAQSITAKTPVIFLSALDDVQNIMQGYDAGGIDYVTRPYRPQELIEKINRSLANAKLVEKLDRKAKSAKKIAYEAMNTAERVNMIVKFMEDCTRLNDLASITRKIFDILHPMGLRSSVLVFTQNKTLYFSDDQLEKPLEVRLLEKVHEDLQNRMAVSGRLVAFNDHMIISYDHVALLIRNYSEEEHEHLLDFLAGLLNGVEMKMLAVDDAIRTACERQQQGDKLIEQARHHISDLQSVLSGNESRVLSLINVLLGEINTILDTFTLTATQQTDLLELIEHSMEELVQIYTTGSNIDTPLSDVLDDMKAFITICTDPISTTSGTTNSIKDQ